MLVKPRQQARMEASRSIRGFFVGVLGFYTGIKVFIALGLFMGAAWWFLGDSRVLYCFSALHRGCFVVLRVFRKFCG